MRVGELAAALRHERLLLVRDEAIEQATLGIARIDRLAAAPPGHHAVVAAQVKPAARLVGVVAVDAGLHDDGAYVVEIGDLLLCLRGRGEGDKTGESEQSKAHHVCVRETAAEHGLVVPAR